MTDTFREDFQPFDVIPSDFANRTGDALNRLSDEGTIGQVVTKIVNGQGVETWGFANPAVEVVADYQPPHVSTFGANGVTKTFTIPHNLGSTTPHVTFWEPDGSGGFVGMFGVRVQSSADGDSITASFSALAPAAGSIVNISIGGGKDGPAIRILGSKASSAALPSTGQELGTAWITEDDGHAWAYTGSLSGGAINGYIDLGPVAVAVLPLPLYTVTGHGATLPPGETVEDSYATLAAFEAAVSPTTQGEEIQLAYDGEVRLLVGRFLSGAFVWVEIGVPS